MQTVTFIKNGRKITYRRVQEKKLPDASFLRSVCFTGHRPKDLSGYIPINAYQWIIDMIMHYVLMQYETGIRRFISGGAQGIDQLSFRAVRQAAQRYSLNNIVNSVYIPFEGQEAFWMDKGSFGKDQYYDILDAADEIILLNKGVTAQEPYWTIVKALDARNKKMLHDSERLLAWYNGSNTGGTFNCIRDALVIGMDVIYMSP